MKQKLNLNTLPALTAGLLTVLFAQVIPAVGATFTRVQLEFFDQHPGFFYNIAWGDYDDDGHLDFLITNTLDAPNFLFKNLGDGTFKRITDSGIEQDNPSSGASVVWGDYDNDGDLDLFLSNYYARGRLQHPDSPYHEIYRDVQNLGYDFYYQNEGDGSFTKVTEGELVTTLTDAYGSQSVAFDYDNDGFLDMFVGSSYNNENYLFHNNGDGTMTEVGGAVRPGMWESHGVTTTDYDNDGYLELIVTGQDDMQFNNNGGTLEVGPLKKGPGTDWGPVAGDFDNDGDMDLIIAGEDNRYFQNDAGTYTEKADVGIYLNDNVESVGAWAADYDNDGYLDLFFTNHMGTSNFLFHNDGDGTFTQVFSEIMTYDGGFGWAAPWADYDNDGDMDIIMADGTIWPQEFGPYPIRLYQNQGNANNWVTFKLEGTVSNRDAVGAKVRIRAIVDGQPVEQMREISTSQGSGSQSDMRAHFGLGDAEMIDYVFIKWPSGIEQKYKDKGIKKIHEIVESEQWAWYDIRFPEMEIETGEWMGRMNVAHAPWIWCQMTECWFYMDEETGLDEVGWMHVSNLKSLLLPKIEGTDFAYSHKFECWFYAPGGTVSGWIYRL